MEFKFNTIRKNNVACGSRRDQMRKLAKKMARFYRNIKRN